MKSGFYYLRATLVVALFFHIALNAWAKSETYKDLIDKAYNLSLQKDRLQAMNVLVNGLKREKKSAVAQKELTTALENLSGIFYSDKAQQLYELALSIRMSDANMAQTKLSEAAKIEPNNLAIETAAMRLALAAGDCDSVEKKLNKYKDLESSLEELKLLRSQALICLGRFDDYLKEKSQVDLKKSRMSLFWSVLEMEYLYRSGNFAKLKETATAVDKIDKNFPEAAYWLWKSAVDTKEPAETLAQKYLATCKSLSIRSQREYLPEPNTCRRTTEVETFLKKLNNSES